MKHWADGGETKLANLITLCTFHHMLVHEGGYGVTATDDGIFVFTRPDGSRIPESNAAECFRGIVVGRVSHDDAAPEIQRADHQDDESDLDDFERALRSYLRETNPELHVDAQTARCRWLGETLDYSFAIEGLQCLDRSPPPV